MNHAQFRALERHGIFLGPKELRQIAKDIILRRGIMLKRQESGDETWLVKIRKKKRERTIRLIFNPEMCKILTILPHGMRRPDPKINDGRWRRKNAGRR